MLKKLGFVPERHTLRYRSQRFNPHETPPKPREKERTDWMDGPLPRASGAYINNRFEIVVGKYKDPKIAERKQVVLT